MDYLLLEQSKAEFLQMSKLARTSADIKAVADIKAKSNASDAPKLDVIAGVARIKIHGVLVDDFDWYLHWWDEKQTVYSHIVSQLQEAENDPFVTEVVLDIDSPGGGALGMFRTALKLHSFSKKITARVKNALSAGYGLACCADEIKTVDTLSLVGSIGTIAYYENATSTELNARFVSRTSTDAEAKNPKANTEGGEVFIKSTLDDFQDKFLSIIEKGRNVSRETINSKFGNGAVIFAEKALELGMIDEILTEQTLSVENSMDFEQLQKEAPELVAKIQSDAKSEGLIEGRKEGLKHACEHLKLAKTSGKYELASECIENDSELNADIMTKHLDKVEEIIAIEEGNAPNLKAAIETKEQSEEDAFKELNEHFHKK